MKNKYIFLIVVLVLIVAGASYFLIGIPISCESQYNEIENAIDESNYCQVDSDCDVLALGGSYIEFGCYHFINKEVDKQPFYDKMKRYTPTCSNMIDECMPAPEPKCVSNKCISAEG